MTHKIADHTQTLFASLVAWELLGREDIDPKPLLREVPLKDLCVVQANIGNEQRFASEILINAELAYRTGRLASDWTVRRSGTNVTIEFQLLKPVEFVKFDMVVEEVVS